MGKGSELAVVMLIADLALPGNTPAVIDGRLGLSTEVEVQEEYPCQPIARTKLRLGLIRWMIGSFVPPGRIGAAG